MATYDQRVQIDFRFGQLSGGVDSLATSLSSPAFAALPSDLSTTRYLPITLADDSQSLYEVVWITGHAAGSQAVTVVRGREGSSARTWGSGTVWRHGPTARDAIPTYATRAALPTDGHLGMKAAIQNEAGAVVEKTPTGWSDRPGGGRKHGWRQLAAAPTPNAAPAAITGWTPDAGNPTIATMSAGQLLLNRPGIWSLTYMVYSDATVASSALMYLDWPAGAWAPTFTQFADLRHRTTGWTRAGTLYQHVSWTGFVTAAQAAQAIQALLCSNASGSPAISFDCYLIAELLGA